LEKVDDNAYKFNLPPYMHIYSIANVENLKLYGPSILDQENEQILPTIEEVTPKFQEELEEDTFFHKNHKTTRKGQHGL